MFTYVVLVIVLLRPSVATRRDVDECIRGGARLQSSAIITQNDFNSSSCAIILTGRPFVVIQPININLRNITNIKVFLLIREGVNTTKRLIIKFYGVMAQNLIFRPNENEEFALVITSDPIYDIGTFSISFRTECYSELFADAFSIISSPNFYLNSSYPNSTRCTYRIMPGEGRPLRITFNVRRLEDCFDVITINGLSIDTQSFLLDGSQIWEITFSSDDTISDYGFEVVVHPDVLTPRLVSTGQIPFQGVVQVAIQGNWYSLQRESVSLSRGHILCSQLGYISVTSVSSRIHNFDTRLLFLMLQCGIHEYMSSNCQLVDPRQLFYIYYYYKPIRAAFLTCDATLRPRLLNGTQDEGYVQINLMESWGYICKSRFMSRVADSMCKQLGFSRALEISGREMRQTSPANFYHVRCDSNHTAGRCHYDLAGACPQPRVMWIRCTNYSDNSMLFFNGPRDYPRYRNKLICSNGLSRQNVYTLCTSLGYNGSSGVDTGPLINDTFYHWKCPPGNADCHFSGPGPCRSNRPLFLACKSIFLRGGSDNRGRVEMVDGKITSLVCGENFTIASGHVICGQLGFAFAVTIDTIIGATNGNTKGVTCTGIESFVDKCEVVDSICPSRTVVTLTCSTQRALRHSPTSKCGESNSSPSSTQNKAPWIVRLHPRNTNNWCTATMIAQSWLITDASCLSIPTSFLTITTDTKISFSISEVYIHPLYSKISGSNNAALVKIAGTISDIAGNSFACLPPIDVALASATCEIIGWSQSLGATNNTLKSRQANFMGTEYCRHFAAGRGNNSDLCEDNIPEVDMNVGSENGSPIVCYYGGRSTVVGMVTRPATSRGSYRLTYHEGLNYYLPWIIETVK